MESLAGLDSTAGSPSTDSSKHYLTILGTKHDCAFMPTTDPQMLKGLITLLLLHLVGERDDYGYALVVRLQQAGLPDLAEGTVYPALARCERAGWVEAYLIPSARGPARKYYRLTADGRVELARSLDAWNNLTSLVASVTSKETPS